MLRGPSAGARASVMRGRTVPEPVLLSEAVVLVSGLRVIRAHAGLRSGAMTMRGLTVMLGVVLVHVRGRLRSQLARGVGGLTMEVRRLAVGATSLTSVATLVCFHRACCVMLCLAGIGVGTATSAPAVRLQRGLRCLRLTLRRHVALDRCALSTEAGASVSCHDQSPPYPATALSAPGPRLMSMIIQLGAFAATFSAAGVQRLQAYTVDSLMCGPCLVCTSSD